MIRCGRQNVAEFKTFELELDCQRVMKMQTTNYYRTDAGNSDILEQLDREFDNGRVYGLEYILEDLKMTKTKEQSSDHSFDWFGLNDLTRM